MTGVSPEALKANEYNKSSSRTHTIKEAVPETRNAGLLAVPPSDGSANPKKFSLSVMASVLYSRFLTFSLAFFLYGLRPQLHIHFAYTQVNNISLSSLRKTIGFETEYRNSIQTKCQTCRYMTLTAVLM